MRNILGLVLLAGMFAGLCKAAESDTAREAKANFDAYRKVVLDTERMVSEHNAQALAQKAGLNILNLTWEDTGRYKDSSVGPNISDMTIQVQVMDPRTEKFELHCMPVIRFPNFEDKTADLAPDKFQMLVGNEKGGDLKRITLKQFLSEPRKYLTKSDSWKGVRNSLLADRDTHVLVSAQACFLPVPKQGLAIFNPVIFNYQSYEGDPAVLTILASREGTSVTVIDNKRDGFQAGQTWGQRLFFNKNGERAPFTGKRLSDYKIDQTGGSETPLEKTPEANEQQGLNMVLLIQIPLKQKKPIQFQGGVGGIAFGGALPAAAPNEAAKFEKSDVEEAVIGHGKVEGPFTEVAGLDIERDPKFPVRVTVQFYKATSNGVVSAADLTAISEQIKKVYANADYVGSLVTEGFTGRPTEYDGEKFVPPGWWNAFWQRHQANTNQTPEEALKMLRKILGKDWTPRNEEELLAALQKAEKDK